jgi:hypothetical protein
MLVILAVFPFAAPFKSCFDKQVVAQVAFFNLVREIRIAV